MAPTRLEKLVALLANGLSEASRLAAARQLGDLQRSHPRELHTLLQHILRHLFSSEWATRRAAAAALEAVADAVDQWSPHHPEEADAAAEDAARSEAAGAWLRFDSFQMSSVLAHGRPLLASAGVEFDEEAETASTGRERLLRQRKLLQEQLGMEAVAQALEGTVDEILHETDLSSAPAASLRLAAWASPAGEDAVAVARALEGSGDALSARARNQARRQAKARAARGGVPMPLAQPDAPKRPPPAEPSDAPHPKRAAPGDEAAEVAADMDDVSWLDSDAWPFEPLCAELRCSLFHPKWERRHGAASGLRALLRRHGGTAGSVGGVRECVSAELCAQWLEDCGLRLLSVLALDRFGDWAAGDRVTAPVRETAAQALAVTVRAMGGGAAEAVARALLTMAGEAVWEVRHGALLALKYTLAARAEMPPSLLPLCAPPLVEALGDADDDVRGAAASALLGVGAQLRPTVPLLLPQLLGAVWAALVKLDDLTASTGSVMMLGAKLSRELPYAQLCAAQAGDEDAAEAVRQWEGREQECLERGSALFLRVLPRLWPFLRHPAADTRCAAVATLHSLVTAAAYAAPPTWLPPLLPTALRLLLQAAFLDPSDKVHAAASDAWHALLTHAPLPSLRSAAAAHRAGWLALASIPPGGSLDPALLLCPSYEGGHDDAAAAKAAEAAVASAEAQARVAAALGSLASVCGLKDGWEAVLRDGLGSASTTRRQLAAWTVAEWAAHARRGGTGGGGSAGVKEEALAVKREVLGVGEDGFTCPSLYSATCLCLSSADACCEVAPELAPCLAVLRAEATNLTTAFERAGLPRTTMTDGWPRGGPLSLAGAEAILGSLAPAWEAALRVPANAASRIRCREAREMLAGAAAALRRAKSELLIQVRAAAAEAIVSLGCLPEKVSPLINALMQMILTGAPTPQDRAATALASLLRLLLARPATDKGHPADKVLAKVCSFLGAPPPAKADASPADAAEETSIACRAAVGGERVLRACCGQFSPALFERLPALWQLLAAPLGVAGEAAKGSGEGTEAAVTRAAAAAAAPPPLVSPALSTSLACCSALLPTLPPADADAACLLLPRVLSLLLAPDPTDAPTRNRAARCAAAFCSTPSLESRSLHLLWRTALPALGRSDLPAAQLGATAAVQATIDAMGMSVLPYAMLMLPHLIGALSAQPAQVRTQAAAAFASLMPLLPLEDGTPDPPHMPDQLRQARAAARESVAPLLGKSKPRRFEVPVRVSAELRDYQQEGVDWLAFLWRFGLHGVLSDDMGLGKTLQTLCILATSRHHSIASASSPCAARPSLVVCPATLTSHWRAEAHRYIGPLLETIEYAGPPTKRSSLRASLSSASLVVTSYETLRADADALAGVAWDFVVLDEGHIIKNAHSKVARAAKGLSAAHRLVLSGTPIQNDALEMWSLFDFLMPGYLGEQAHFNAHYVKPIQASYGARTGDAAFVAGEDALKRLHRQVLPFCLRRTKEAVLSELPPKIIADRMVDLSPVQSLLYSAFASSPASEGVKRAISTAETETGGATTVLSALQYLRKVCNHPLLALMPDHPLKAEAERLAAASGATLSSIAVAPKLVALKQILEECGIGASDAPSEGADDAVGSAPAAIASHRALVFAQSSLMLDRVEQDLLTPHLPSVAHLRLDGRVPAARRGELVERFNSDPSIDLMLLTTSVGGLGLNLTSADTVIFLDHDWNPMKDLQAMDRAHRLGQRRSVSVFRLITRGTLEEKIMSLQRFKVHVAGSVVNADNASVQQMSTDEVLDLLELSPVTGTSTAAAGEGAGAAAGGGGRGLQSLLTNVGNLWAEEEYEQEYDLDEFLDQIA